MTDGMRDEWDPDEVMDAEQFNGLVETFAMGPDGELVFRDVDGVTGSVGVFDADGQWCGEPETREIDIPDVPERRRVSEPVPVAASATDDDDAPGGDAGASVGRVRVVPEWMTDRSAVGARAKYAGSQVVFHVVRSPWWALRGLGACVAGMGRWALLVEDRDTYRAAMDGASMEKRHEMRAHRLRGQVGRSVVAVSPALGVWAWVEHGQWGLLPMSIIAAAYVGAAVVGWRVARGKTTPRERAVIASSKGRQVRITEPFITEALEKVKFGRVGDDEPVILKYDRVRGGQNLIIQLAPGLTVDDLMRKNANLASALGRPTECVVIEPRDEEAEGRFDLFIADKTLAQRGSPRWAWRKGGVKPAFFEGVPIGVDRRGNVVTEPLFEANGLIGGATGSGKTNTGRVVAAGASLDPDCRLDIFDLKGGSDWRAFGPVAHTLRAGTSKADIKALLDLLKDYQDEIARRGRIMDSLPSQDVPHSKWTPALGREYGTRLLIIDEPQRALSLPGGVGDEVRARLDDIERTCRASGITVKLLTQGTKEGVIPAGILGQCVRRIGHKVTSVPDGNLILGGASHGDGAEAIKIKSPGIGYVGAAGGEMTKTMVAFMDAPELERVVKIAASQRRKAGTLSGMAAGQIEPDNHDGGSSAFLGDVLRVWPVGEDGQRWEKALSATLAERLAVMDEYEGVTGPDVTRRMRGAGVQVGSKRTPAGGGQGVKLGDVERVARA